MAYIYGSLLSVLCLNLTDDLYQYINIPTTLKNTWGTRAEFAIRSKNPAFAFFFLCFNSPIERGQTANEWLDATVRKAGLPPVDEIEQMANAEIQSITPAIDDKNLFDRLVVILQAGKENFSTLGIRGIRPDFIMKNLLKLPPILFGDGVFVSFGESSIDFKYYNESIHSMFWGFEEKILDFLTACSIF